MIRLSYTLFLLGFCLMCTVKGYNFGFNDSYTCHCLNDRKCNDQTGTCNNGCSKQWVGPSCQQENIAYSKTANQSSQEADRGPLVVVDGDRSFTRFLDCADTGFSPWAWWLVNLGRLFSIRYLKIYYKSDRLSYFKGFSVHIDNELCYQHTGTSNPPAVFSIECNRTITGRYVNISNNRPGSDRHFFSLCEVEIYVCSKRTYGSDCNNFCHCSNYDECNVKTGQCPDGCQIGWEGSSCNTKCQESYGQDCRKQCSDRKCSGTSTCHHVTGECITGCRTGYQGIDCTEECHESYGQDCRKQCSDRKCQDQTSCNNIDGECIGGCQTGYRSLDCTEWCTSGLYGLNCNSSCSDRFCKIPTTTCHHETGACSEDGCRDYYDGVDCTQYIGCTNGYYGFGDGCNKLCSERNCIGGVNSTCDQVNGTCSGCLVGYRGHDCTVEINLDSRVNGGRLGYMEFGITGTVVGFIVGILVGVGLHHCWVARKRKAKVPEAYYEDITMESRQTTRDCTTDNHERQQQNTVEPQGNQQRDLNQDGQLSGTDRNGNSASMATSDSGHNYYNLQNDTYEELKDRKEDATDYLTLKYM